MKKYLVLIAAVATLTACVSGKAPSTSYTGRDGSTTLIQTDSEMCASSCNNDNSRCMDSSNASQNITGIPNATPGEAPGTFGPASECRSELSDCLRGCKSR